MPARFQKQLSERFGSRVKMIFSPQMLNPAEARNVGLRAISTRLAVLMDNDVYVRTGWLEALMKCEKETSAAMVVPIVLEDQETIHTAGNVFYVTYKKGKAYASKELALSKHTYWEGSNLKRQKTDYGELHCQLVDVQTALKLNVYDEEFREVGECDSGFIWAKAGCGQWFEPAAVVDYPLPRRVEYAEDIPFFLFKWDMREILRNYLYFEKKWNINIAEQGSFKFFLKDFNNKLGLLPRLFRFQWVLKIDHGLQGFRRAAENSFKVWGYLKAKAYGFDEWSKHES